MFISYELTQAHIAGDAPIIVTAWILCTALNGTCTLLAVGFARGLHWLYDVPCEPVEPELLLLIGAAYATVPDALGWDPIACVLELAFCWTLTQSFLVPVHGRPRWRKLLSGRGQR